VGKTTIALNLAKQLVKKAPVIMLDFDITGTSISGPAAQSPFWEKETNVLKDRNGEVLNLLGYYMKNFIHGKSRSVEFITADNVQGKQINVIGSDIYGANSKAIVDTRMLMDDIHSYWLVEFLQMIISSFESLFPEQIVHVIVDNSPGYVGFCESLHNYMFNLGPEKAKFIMVASLDYQDLRACLSASAEICKNVKDRFLVAKYFNSLMSKNPLSKEENPANDDDELKKFFFELREDKELLATYSQAVYDETKYISLILNKVPQTYKEDSIMLSFKDIVGEDNLDLFNKITSESDGSPQSVIYYDDAIVYQNYLIYLRSQGDSNSSYWTRRLKDLEEANEELEIKGDDISSINKLGLLYSNLLINMNRRGYARMARQMSPRWSPSYAISRLSDFLSSLTRRVTSIVSDDTSSYKESLHDWINGQSTSLREYIESDYEYRQLQALFYMAEEMLGRWDEKVSQQPMELLAVYYHFLATIIIKKKDKKMSFYDFILNLSEAVDYSTEISINSNDKLIITDDYIIEVRDYRRYLSLHFNRFLRYFTYAYVRMCDKHVDFNMLLSALKLYVQKETLLPFSKEMIDYLNAVISYKINDHNIDKLTEIKNNSLVMKNAQVVLRDFVLKYWD
jgi:hypothetical protein